MARRTVDERTNQADPGKLMTKLPQMSTAAEAYRALRTNLQFLSSQRDIKTLAITSANPSAGKSLTAANLAIAMAQMGRKTLLVDADLRRPTLHLLFNLEPQDDPAASGGLVHVLAGLTSDPSIEQPEPALDQLYLLPCGPVPPNPGELVCGARMTGLLERLRADFEMVILDTPPALAAADTLALASLVDGALLVISNRSDLPAVARAKRALERVNAQVLGAVYNGARHQGESYGDYHQYN